MSQSTLHAKINDACQVAQQEIAILAKLLTAQSNRSFDRNIHYTQERFAFGLASQRGLYGICYTRERFELAKMETENWGYW